MTTSQKSYRNGRAVWACGFRSGIDVLRLNQLSDELEIEDSQRKLAAELSHDPA
jgi:hypothetical protein